MRSVVGQNVVMQRVTVYIWLGMWNNEHKSVSQPPGRGPVPGPGINYTGPGEILLELITNLNVILYLSTCYTVHIIVLIFFMIMP